LEVDGTRLRSFPFAAFQPDGQGSRLERPHQAPHHHAVFVLYENSLALLRDRGQKPASLAQGVAGVADQHGGQRGLRGGVGPVRRIGRKGEGAPIRIGPVDLDQVGARLRVRREFENQARKEAPVQVSLIELQARIAVADAALEARVDGVAGHLQSRQGGEIARKDSVHNLA
jgi:hypothetical protein